MKRCEKSFLWDLIRIEQFFLVTSSYLRSKFVLIFVLIFLKPMFLINLLWTQCKCKNMSLGTTVALCTSRKIVHFRDRGRKTWNLKKEQNFPLYYVGLKTIWGRIMVSSPWKKYFPNLDYLFQHYHLDFFSDLLFHNPDLGVI